MENRVGQSAGPDESPDNEFRGDVRGDGANKRRGHGHQKREELKRQTIKRRNRPSESLEILHQTS